MSCYDAHFIILKMKAIIDGSVSVLPINNERYISFTVTINRPNKKDFTKYISFRFIDSFKFMQSSLDKRSAYLHSDQLTNLKSEMISTYNNDQIGLMYCKGVFPYDYVDSWSKYDDEMLPTQEQSYSKLTESHISDSDYNYAKLVWEAFNNIQDLGPYSDLYLKIYVMLLADVFDNFRDTCHQIYKLDPAHYFTAPGLSWDAMLKFTKVKIQLLTDVDMFMFVEQGLRGGISQCSQRHAKANNKYMGEDYDPSKPDEYLVYLDANNLYGWAMMQCLPLSGFEWMADPNIDVFNTR